MKKITLVLSACVMEQIDEIAVLLKVPRSHLISFLLQGSTYPIKTISRMKSSFCQ